MTRAWLAALLAVGCASGPQTIPTTTPVALRDGSTVELIALREIVFPDGARGLEILYRTQQVLESDAMFREFGFVLFEFSDDVKARGYSGGAVHATRELPQAGKPRESRLMRFCFTEQDRPLWLLLTGEPSEQDRAAGKGCRREEPAG